MGCGASSHLQQTTTPVVAALVYAQSHQQAGGASASSGGALHDAAAAKVHAADNTTTSVATSDTPRDGAFRAALVGPDLRVGLNPTFFFPGEVFLEMSHQNKTKHGRKYPITKEEVSSPAQRRETPINLPTKKEI